MDKSLWWALARSLFKAAYPRLMLLALLLFFSPLVYALQEQRKVTISGTNISIQKIFQTIKKRTGLTVFYSNDLLNDKERVTVDFREEELDQVLDYLLKGRNITYEIRRDKVIVLSRIREKETTKTEQSQVHDIVQSISVSGKITDEKGEGLPGVSILIKGTQRGMISDAGGSFTIEVPDEKAVLVFSFIGYASQEAVVGNRTTLNIVMKEDMIGLEEVVAVGYGTMKKSDLTGATVSANIEAFRESPNVNILQSLQGSVPGVQIGQVNQAGQEPSIAIRGTTTISGNQSPLIVVDGIIYSGRIGDLNPNDIKSVDILKDASSQAIYGARAANGVILITTKSGKTAKRPTINYSGKVSVFNPTRNTRLLNREEYLQLVKDKHYPDAFLAPDYIRPNPDWGFEQVPTSFEIVEGLQSNTEYNWWKALTSPGFLQDHFLSVSGGTENTTYYLSGGFSDQSGYIRNDNYQRKNVMINVETDITKWLTVGAKTMGAFTDFSGVYPNLNMLMRTVPVVEPKDKDGNWKTYPFGLGIVNPFFDALQDDKELKNRLSGIFYGVVKIPGIEGLSYRINYSNNLNWSLNANSNIYGAGFTGRASKDESSTLNMMLDNILTYDKQLKDHGITATLVAGYNKVKYEAFSAVGDNIPNQTLSYNSLQQAIIQRITSSAWEETGIYQMGRINYNFKNRYLATATLRRDGFSGFARDNKFALFPSFGLGWVLSEEPFFEFPRIDYLKFRVSYGSNGNQTGRYSSLARISAGSDSHYIFGDGASTSLGQSIASLSNASLSWERTAGFNFGVDFGIFNNIIRGNVEYYRTATTDLLWNKVLPLMTGFSQITTNIGRISNSGLEFSVQTTPVRTNHFKWNLDVNFSANNNRIVTLIGEDTDGDGKEDDLIASGLFIGKSLGAIYDYKIDGIWQLSEDISTGFAPGSYRIVDQNNDGVITARDDRIILGRSEPSYRFGIQSAFNYRDFTLRLFINSIQGGRNNYLGIIQEGSQEVSTRLYNRFAGMLDFWSPSNPGGTYASSTAYHAVPIMATRYQSRSFIRLQDISLAYRLKPFIKLFVSGKNVLTFTKWDGWDPETGAGAAVGSFPTMKSYTFGVDISL